MKRIGHMNGYRFINRELSWIEFNDRVLQEASSAGNPLFEQLKFASIVCSNLDEFFMIRVASVYDQFRAGLTKGDSSGLTTAEIIERISLRCHELVRDLYRKYKYSLVKGLRKQNIRLLGRKNLSSVQRRFLDGYFETNVFPVLTPMLVDRGRPFPLVLNKSLNIALLIAGNSRKAEPQFASVQVPSVLNRLIELPSSGPTRDFILMEEIIKLKLKGMFAGYRILAKACYRITRNADLSINEEGAEDLFDVIQESLRQRKWGAVIRLEIEKNADGRILERLTYELEVTAEKIYSIHGPLDLRFLMEISSQTGFEHLRYPAWQPAYKPSLPKGSEIFEIIRKEDVLLHHPYDSFEHIVEFLQSAAEDPRVLAIKQTLYRVSDDSPIMEALAQAAESGKQVTVFVEIKARFDEQNNIQWAKRLEKAGCHVIYGYAGLKTHCKALLVVRMEEDGIRRYVHLGTGNYNEITARLYTDMGLLTANPHIGADASNVFNMLSGLSRLPEMHRLVVAPYKLREKIAKLIQREKQHAEQGKRAEITIKINSLTDKKMIQALYEASSAGVKITLIVRGICCLVPGVPGQSENIRVVSIVGRLLEHSRIYYFYNDGGEAIYLSSADLMERNLDRRVEVMFPIVEDKVKRQVRDILDVVMQDTEKMRKLMPDGRYIKVRSRKGTPVNSQELLHQRAALLKDASPR